MDSNRYMIEKSARTLRGMSWWGSVKNYFSEEPAAPRPRTAVWMARPEAQAATGAAAAAASAAPVESSGPARGQWAEQREAPAGDDDRRELFMRRPGSGGPADEARTVRGRQAPSVSEQEERQYSMICLPVRLTEFLPTPNYPMAAVFSPAQSLAEVRRMQDDHLESLSQAVDQQLQIGATLRGALAEQTEQIERL